MPIHRYLLSPLRELSETGRLSGILLLLATAISLLLSNFGPEVTYMAFWKLKVGLPFLQETIEHWVNDGLMAIFFLLVGLEIKREVLKGELADRRQALLPAVAAIGGAVVPALVFVALNYGQPEALNGWAIPTATDIAFSLGVLSLLGDRVPFSLKVFLTALAIIDDLLAILIIAFFYTDDLHTGALGYAALVLGTLVVLNRFRVRALWPYLLLGVLLWYFVLESGVHATLAGVLLAFCIPMERLEALEHTLHKPVTYVILPVFALANTALPLSSAGFITLTSGLGLGIMLGLLLGKPLGIGLLSALAVRMGWADLPGGTDWRTFLGLGFTAGIGFTMSIFISTLSFPELSAELITAKLATLIGSVASALVGVALLSASPHRPDEA